MPRCPFPPELLAPAGNWDCARAAVENGADAVYFGLDEGFNARARAANFSAESLGELLTFLHRRGVKGYVTLNTLAFSDELERVEQLIRLIAAADADAVLVQDLGVARLVREVCPDLSVHASTQMTLTSAECISAAARLGIDRVVLPRELSVEEIAAIAAASSLPVEVFVHGALCVAYSGQCLTSESLGGRSANRGQCAQACRLPYDLLCDGQDVELGDIKYLLSPQDLAAYDLLPELIEAGVECFKIEGRLKTPEYVANITRHYRAAIDAAWRGRPMEFTRRQVQEMELSFSRGFSPGWLNGCDHKMLVPGKTSAKRGVLLGWVRGIRGRWIEIELDAAVTRGDGIVFSGDRESSEEQGGRVVQVLAGGRPSESPVASGIVELMLDARAIDVSRLRPGQEVWKTDDPQLNKRLRKTFTSRDAVRRVPLDLRVTACTGERLLVMGSAENGAACLLSSEHPLERAVRHPLTAELLRAQLGRLGGTVFELRNLALESSGGPMAPLSVLGGMRRLMIEQLEAPLPERPRRIAEDSVLSRLRPGAAPDDCEAANAPVLHVLSRTVVPHVLCRTMVLHVLCRTMAQLEAALDAGVIDLYAEFQDIRQYREAVAAARRRAARIFLATPRVQKPGEMGIFRAILRQGADGTLIRNLAGMEFFAGGGGQRVADFSLNVTNELTAEFLMGKGAQRVTAGYDLNRDQLLDLAAAIPPEWLEVVIHQHMPMFHMEHCVFCAVLSPGTNKTNCGRPCDVHEVRLRDRVGMEHPLTADVGCRNTLYNAVPQSAAEAVSALISRGIRHFRLELLGETPREAQATISLYRELLAGGIGAKEVWTRLKASNRVGVTRGTLEERRNPLAIL